jgi:hypothetical protein
MGGPRAQGAQFFPTVCALSVTGSEATNAGLNLGLDLGLRRTVQPPNIAEPEVVNSSSRAHFLPFLLNLGASISVRSPWTLRVVQVLEKPKPVIPGPP